MKYLLLIGIIFCKTLDAIEQGQPVMAFPASTEGEKRNDLYEELLKQPLPDWQKAILLYNLGTIQLEKNHWEQALGFFQSIPIHVTPSPKFARSLKINQGLLNLRQAEALSASSDLEELIYLVHTSLSNFKLAEQIDCQIQKFEEDSTSCVPSKDIQNLIYFANTYLKTLNQQEREVFVKEQTSGALFVLNEALEKWIFTLKQFNQASIPTPLQVEYQSYLINLANSLSPLWHNLREQSFNINDKSIIDQAASFYIESVQALEKNHRSESLSLLEKTMESLKQLQNQQSTQGKQQLESLLIHYQLLLLSDYITTPQLRALMNELEELKKVFPNSTLLNQASAQLAISFQQIEIGKLSLAKFFLRSSLSLIEQMQEQKGNGHPETILTQAIKSVQRMLDLNRLLQMEPFSDSLQQEIKAIFNQTQKQIDESTKQFIPSVNALETVRFQQIGKVIYPRCQQKPWDQVIPLFEEGYQAIFGVQNLNKDQQINLNTNQQEKAIHVWKQALQLMQDNLAASATTAEEQQQNQEQPVNGESDKINEVLYLIQEMEAEDSPSRPEKKTGGHAW